MFFTFRNCFYSHENGCLVICSKFESDYVRQEPLRKRGPFVENAYADVDERKKNMEIAQTIDDTLKQYYSKKGKPVPNWRVNKNPQWWVDYLKELGIDQ